MSLVMKEWFIVLDVPMVEYLSCFHNCISEYTCSAGIKWSKLFNRIIVFLNIFVGILVPGKIKGLRINQHFVSIPYHGQSLTFGL